MHVTYLSIYMFVFSWPSHMIGISQSRLHSQRPVHNAARGLYALARHTEAETATQGGYGPHAWPLKNWVILFWNLI